jgi:hypothetical protein
VKYTEIAFYDDGTSGESAQYIANTAEACTTQLELDFCEEYDRKPIPVKFYADKSQIPASAIVIPWSGAMDVSGAIAYHTENGGKVTGLVCAPLARQNGQEPSIAASHEVLETMKDMFCNGSTQAANGNIIDDEVGDPVQDRSYGVPVADGSVMQVSDFVTSAWHDPQSAGEKYSHTDALPGPHTKTDGGYYQFVDPSGQRQQLGERAPWRAPSLRGARREALHAARQAA